MTDTCNFTAVVHTLDGRSDLDPLRLWSDLLLKDALARRQIRTDDRGCWTWTGVLNGGYGMVTRRRRYRRAHRYFYELLVAPIPSGLQLDHLCRNRACVNPAHLEPVTPQENTARTGRGRETHCPQNHPYSGDNLARHDGRRICRTCRATRARQWRQARKVSAVRP